MYSITSLTGEFGSVKFDEIPRSPVIRILCHTLKNAHTQPRQRRAHSEIASLPKEMRSHVPAELPSVEYHRYARISIEKDEERSVF